MAPRKAIPSHASHASHASHSQAKGPTPRQGNQYFLWIVAAVVVGLTAAAASAMWAPAQQQQAATPATPATSTDAPDSTGSSSISHALDPNGYLIIGVTMGRFGNKVDYFIGTLHAAKALNRTLVLPYWPPDSAGRYRPFDEVFQIAELQRYHRVMTTHDFLKQHGRSWQHPRTAYCVVADYGERLLTQGNTGCIVHQEDKDYWAKTGSNIDLANPIGIPVTQYESAEWWQRTLPASEHPVVALARGGLSRFPVPQTMWPLGQFFVLAPKILQQAEKVIRAELPRPYVAVHIRNGIDWESACNGINADHKEYMASPQCDALMLDASISLKDVCWPSSRKMVSQAVEAVKALNASALFIGTDDKPMTTQFKSALSQAGYGHIKIVHKRGQALEVDAAIMQQADWFIGNCVSSFTSFVARYRSTNNAPSAYWNTPGHI